MKDKIKTSDTRYKTNLIQELVTRAYRIGSFYKNVAENIEKKQKTAY